MSWPDAVIAVGVVSAWLGFVGLVVWGDTRVLRSRLTTALEALAAAAAQFNQAMLALGRAFGKAAAQARVFGERIR